jgi:hypothetical protein
MVVDRRVLRHDVHLGQGTLAVKLDDGVPGEVHRAREPGKHAWLVVMVDELPPAAAEKGP